MKREQIDKLPTPLTDSLEYKHFNVLADEIISGEKAASLPALYRELQTKCRSVEQRLAAAVSALHKIHQAMLPDPHDEREISLEWLREHVDDLIGETLAAIKESA